MEDVLEVYQRPYDREYPQVCFDETSKQQIEETRLPLPVEPGHPARYDSEYERNGVSNLFCPAGRLAACQSDGPSHLYRLGALYQRAGRSLFPGREKNCFGVG